MLAGQPVDMVLADYASALLPFEQVAKAVIGCGRDVPLLATSVPEEKAMSRSRTTRAMLRTDEGAFSIVAIA